MSDHDPYDIEPEEPAPARISFEEQERKDFEWLMGSKRGRRIMRSMLAKTGVDQLSYTGHALSSAFNEGRRNVGLALKAQIIGQSTEQFALMLKEHQDDVRRNADDPAR